MFLSQIFTITYSHLSSPTSMFLRGKEELINILTPITYPEGKGTENQNVVIFKSSKLDL